MSRGDEYSVCVHSPLPSQSHTAMETLHGHSISGDPRSWEFKETHGKHKLNMLYLLTE